MNHSWLTATLVDLATYAELNGLKKLHLELCAALATLDKIQSEEFFDSEVNRQMPINGNVVRFARSRS